MDLFDGITSQEQWIVQKATALNLPIGGTMELLPLCNMDCKMCYVRMSKAEMDRQGRLLTCGEWLDIARKAKEAGVLFLLLTGGEPLMYPDFRRLYTELTEMGFIITINTNGTLIDEEWADFFAQRPCRRMNITLYGKDDETYGRLCRNPRGFTQVMNAAALLRQRNIPFRFTFSCTPDNLDQLPGLYELTRSMDIHFVSSSYMFPPARRGLDCSTMDRLTPQRCAESLVTGYRARNPQVPMEIIAKSTLQPLKLPKRNETNGYHCRAGRSGFWINWKGELLPCGMFNEPKENLLDQSFSDAWDKIRQTYQALPLCRDCENCQKRNICTSCPAACYTETGSTAGRPDYLCRTTDALIEQLLPYLSEEEQKEYRELLNETE